jgi:uncharacterized protein YuzE
MTITLDELRKLVASAKSVQPDFWKEDPLYISLGTYADRRVSTTEPFIVNTGSDIAIDLDAEGQAMGIEFLPIGR